MTSSFELIGVVHLLPLPGGPHPSPGLAEVRRRAIHDACVLRDAGFDGVIVENFGDAPFSAGAVEPHVVACMTEVAGAVSRVADGSMRLGINVLRNDAHAALGIAVAVGGSFVRVNILSQATWTDQGLIEGRAHDVLRYRRSLGAHPVENAPGVQVVADVLVKHGVPAGQDDPVIVARETAGRGGADVLVVTGTGTGAPVDIDRLVAVRGAVARPVWIGSGLEPALASALVPRADGAIVGTWLHADSDIAAPLSPTRAEEMAGAVRAEG